MEQPAKHTVKLLFCVLLFTVASWAGSFRFAILGDRTGEAQAGVYERVWADIRAESPAFVVGVGDTIQGGNDNTADSEWREAKRIVTPAWWQRLYLAPGNHDIWSAKSEELFQKHAAHRPHYSFDYQQAHVTVLDNSRTEDLPAGEMEFLEEDLRAHAAQPVKFIVSHRPSWIFEAMLHNAEFPLQRLARKYGAQFIIAGDIHQVLRMKVGGITYLSVGSAAGHLRATKKYEDGWFFGYSIVTVDGNAARFEIKELNSPFGQGRVTAETDWSAAGLTAKTP